MKNKKAQLLQQTLIHIIIIGLVASIFMVAEIQRLDNRGLKQQLLERQTALFIDSAVPGINITIDKLNIAGYVGNVKVEENKIYITVEGLVSLNGYPIFSQYDVRVEEDDESFKIIIE
jgi:Na+-transporting NADH:ubiquinone oxidoreductase subunit NqrC